MCILFTKVSVDTQEKMTGFKTRVNTAMVTFIKAFKSPRGWKPAYLWYSFVRRIMCRDNGLTHFGIFSSAELNGTVSPVSRFTTYTFSSISLIHNIRY